MGLRSFNLDEKNIETWGKCFKVGVDKHNLILSAELPVLLMIKFLQRSSTAYSTTFILADLLSDKLLIDEGGATELRQHQPCREGKLDVIPQRKPSRTDHHFKM